MNKLLRTLIFRPIGRDRLRSVLTVLSVALGVAVVVAIDLAGDSATGSFRSSLETLVGKTDLEITANAGVDEKVLAGLVALPVNARFWPVIETQATIARVGGVTLYGYDFLAQAEGIQSRDPARPLDAGPAIVVSSALASRLNLKAKDQLEILVNDTPRTFEVIALADAGAAEFLALDIAEAQESLGRIGKLDRIDVTVSAGEDFLQVEKAVRDTLPGAYELTRPGARSEENQRMLRAFRWNLRVLSYISLVVGAFLIYNTISVSVVRRRAEIGILRAIGASRTLILWLFLGEAFLFGAAGSLLGVGLGRLLAEGAVGLIAETVNALYTSSTPAPVTLSSTVVLTGVIAGMLVAILSALGPALQALTIAPTEAMGRGSRESQARVSWRRDLIAGAVLAVAAAIASGFGPVEGKPVFGYAAALLAIGAAALASPALVLAVTRMGKSAVRALFGAEGMIASRSLASSLGRTSVVVAALATAIAMMASVGIMVGSFRQTVLVWLDSQLRADIYIRPSGRAGAGQFPALSPQVPALVARTPGVAEVDVFHAFEFRYGQDRAILGAGDLDIIRRKGRMNLVGGGDRDAVLRSLAGADRAIVSEPFANKHGVRTGDVLPLRIGARDVRVTVAGVYYEYSSERGYVILDRSTLLRYLPDQPATNMGVYLAPGADSQAVQRAIQQACANYRITVSPNSTLRREAVIIFDRTFAITYALEGVAIFVAMLGAANSLLALVLDRRRELGMLRFLGAHPTQIRKMILMEAGFLGLLSSTLGLILGFILSLLLIYVVNKQSFGWTIQFQPPALLISGAVLLIWCATVIAGLYPARIASRLKPIEVIHEE